MRLRPHLLRSSLVALALACASTGCSGAPEEALVLHETAASATAFARIQDAVVDGRTGALLVAANGNLYRASDERSAFEIVQLPGRTSASQFTSSDKLATSARGTFFLVKKRLYVTTDGGLSWQQSPLTFAASDGPLELLPADGALYLRVWVSHKETLLRSLDDGATFETIGDLADGWKVWVGGDSVVLSKEYPSYDRADLSVSTNRGTSFGFRTVNHGFTSAAIDGRYLVAGGMNNLGRIDLADENGQWVSLALPVTPPGQYAVFADEHALYAHGDDLRACTYAPALMASTDGGRAWGAQTFPAAIQAPRCSFAATATLFNDGTGLFLTHDNGRTWKSLPSANDS